MTIFLRTLSSSLVTISVTKSVRSLVARLYETVTTVPGSWVRWRAVFQNDSRVLERCSESFLIYIYCIQCDFSTKSKYGDKKVKYWSMNLVMNLVIWSNSSFKSCLNFKFKILTKPCAQSISKSLTFFYQTSASKSATNCCQQDPHQQQLQHQQVLSWHLQTPGLHQSSLLNVTESVSESVSYWQA